MSLKLCKTESQMDFTENVCAWQSKHSQNKTISVKNNIKQVGLSNAALYECYFPQLYNKYNDLKAVFIDLGTVTWLVC